jgi:hypothetical protein
MRKKWVWVLAALGACALVVAGVSFYLDTVLRDSIERGMNERLKGYTVRIGAVRFHPIGFSLDLLDTTAVQDANPDPPVLRIPRLRASVNWRALLHRRLVADFLVESPKVYLNLVQAKQEIQDPKTVRERGWQDALEAIYPLKVNEFLVRDGELTYVEEGPFRPLQLSRVNFRAENIRNIKSPDHVYPSGIRLEGVVFDSGRIALDGNADFLATPHAGIRSSVSLQGIDLDYFKPILKRYNLSVKRGVLATSGHFEYAPRTKVVNLKEVSIQDADIEYVHKAKTAAAELQTAKEIQRAAKQVSNSPDVLLRLDKLNILQTTFRFRNEAADPPYRAYLADAQIRLANVSNQRAEGIATGNLKGKFLGSGDTAIDFAFWPEGKRLDFDVETRIDGTDMRKMNDLLRTYAGFDVDGGQFSFYAEVKVRRGNITGYIKPLFKDMKVYDADQDRDKPFFQQVKERLIGGIAWILENRPRQEVATRIKLSGSLDSPQFSTWQAAAGFLRNAFMKAILPGLEEAPLRRGR